MPSFQSPSPWQILPHVLLAWHLWIYDPLGANVPLLLLLSYYTVNSVVWKCHLLVIKALIIGAINWAQIYINCKPNDLVPNTPLFYTLAKQFQNKYEATICKAEASVLILHALRKWRLLTRCFSPAKPCLRPDQKLFYCDKSEHCRGSEDDCI